MSVGPVLPFNWPVPHAGCLQSLAVLPEQDAAIAVRQAQRPCAGRETVIGPMWHRPLNGSSAESGKISMPGVPPRPRNSTMPHSEPATSIHALPLRRSPESYGPAWTISSERTSMSGFSSQSRYPSGS